jgi:DNA-directed RNA polymerase omega subunit
MGTKKLGAVVSEDIDLNPFQLVIVGAERARQLMRGSRPMIETEARHPTAVVLEEFSAGMLRADPLTEPIVPWQDAESQGEIE